MNLEREPVGINLTRFRGGDEGGSNKGVTPVCEPESTVCNVSRVRALLLQGVLDLEKVREVGRGLDPDLDVDRIVGMIEDRQSSWNPSATRRRRMTVCLASTYTV